MRENRPSIHQVREILHVPKLERSVAHLWWPMWLHQGHDARRRCAKRRSNDTRPPPTLSKKLAHYENGRHAEKLASSVRAGVETTTDYRASKNGSRQNSQLFGFSPTRNQFDQLALPPCKQWTPVFPLAYHGKTRSRSWKPFLQGIRTQCVEDDKGGKEMEQRRESDEALD